MEAAIANLTEPGETIVVGNKGIWGQRVCDLAERYGGMGVSIVCVSIIVCVSVIACVSSHTCNRHLQHIQHTYTTHPKNTTNTQQHPPTAKVVNLEVPAGRSVSYTELQQAVETHKPALLFLCQVGDVCMCV